MFTIERIKRRELFEERKETGVTRRDARFDVRFLLPGSKVSNIAVQEKHGHGGGPASPHGTSTPTAAASSDSQTESLHVRTPASKSEPTSQPVGTWALAPPAHFPAPSGVQTSAQVYPEMPSVGSGVAAPARGVSKHDML